MKTIEVENADPNNSDYQLVIMLDKIVYADKLNSTDIARIHLTNGEILLSTESLKTIQARIDLAKDSQSSI